MKLHCLVINKSFASKLKADPISLNPFRQCIIESHMEHAQHTSFQKCLEYQL